MKILIDTREQLPLTFNHPYVEGTQRCLLDVGDYGAIMSDGHIPSIFFERKTVADLLQTMTVGYKRFKREIRRNNEAGNELILIIEGTITDVFKGHTYTTVKGAIVFKTVLSLYERYGVHHIFCTDREEMATYIVEKFCAYERKRQRDLKCG